MEARQHGAMEVNTKKRFMQTDSQVHGGTIPRRALRLKRYHVRKKNQITMNKKIKPRTRRTVQRTDDIALEMSSRRMHNLPVIVYGRPEASSTILSS